MNITAIARITNEDGKLLGLRLIDGDSHKTMDASVESIIDKLSNGVITIHNIGTESKSNGEYNLVGTNGSIERLPEVTNGKVKGSSIQTILSEAYGYYKVSNYEGRIMMFNRLNAVNFTKEGNISNAKIVKINNTEHISPIKGEYLDDTMKVKNTKVPNTSLGMGEVIEKANNYITKIKMLGVTNPQYKIKIWGIYGGVELIGFRGGPDINIPEFITDIGDVFRNYGDINKIVFGGHVLYPYLNKIILFKYKGVETNVVVPSCVDEIENYAFCSYDNYDNLEGVTLGYMTKKIGEGAFKDCRKLKEVRLSTALTEIGDKAFMRCRALEDIVITNSVKIIGEGAFMGCTNLRSIKIPDNVTVIKRSAFEGCERLESVVIGNKVNTIPPRAFYGCSRLKSVELPNKLKSIQLEAFRGCANLNKIELSECLKNIGTRAFRGSGIEEITLFENIKKIQDDAFQGCRNLKVVNAITDYFSMKDLEYIFKTWGGSKADIYLIPCGYTD